MVSRSSSQQRPAALYDAIYTAGQVSARRKLQEWGRFVATHQIAVLLLCCVFLCTLTYPVLSLYAWAAPSSTSDFFSFLRASPTWSLLEADATSTRARDVRLPWYDLDALVVNSEDACWQRIPKFREITVQQVLLGFAANADVASEHGILDRKALHTLKKLETRLAARLNQGAGSAVRCLHAQSPTADHTYSPKCLFFSPSSYWKGQEQEILSDTSLIATINSPNHTYHDVPLTQHELFAGRSYTGSALRKADYAVLTLFLEGPVETGDIDPVLQDIANELDLVLSLRTSQNQKLVMKHRSDVRVRPVLWEDIVFYFGYFVVGVYIYLTLRRLDKVHSRSGLVVTGIVQMLASGMMSLSICALVGYKINLVPWKLIPFLIVVLGVDNMFVLTSAVSGTSIHLPVKERVAEGLARSGVSIFFNLVAEIVALNLLYFAIPTRVIREMVVFGGVALVMEYILEMTYFITVLSIDMQRLELADLITQGSRTSPKLERKPVSQAGIPRLAEGIFKSIQERKARTYTACLLVFSNYVLYVLYGAEYFVPAFCSNVNFSESGSERQPPPTGNSVSPSEAFWKLLGAGPSEALHVHVAPPSFLLFNIGQGVSAIGSTFSTGTLYAVVKFFILPVALTTLALYGVLLQLLKGSERLNRVEHVSESEDKDAEKPLQQHSSITIGNLLTPRLADIEVLTCNRDATFCASWVPLERCIVITQMSSGEDVRLPLKAVLKPREIIISIALSDSAAFCACATSEGRLIIWSVKDEASPSHIFPKPGTTLPHVVTIFSETSMRGEIGPSASARPSGNARNIKGAYYSLHTDGALYRWDCYKRLDHPVIPAMDHPGKCLVLHSPSGAGTAVVRCASTTSMEIWQKDGTSFDLSHTLNPQPAPGWTLTSGAYEIVDGQSILALGWSSGTVQLFAWTSEPGCIGTVAASNSQIDALRITSVEGLRCSSCSNELGPAVLLASASAARTRLYRLSARQGDGCACWNSHIGSSSLGKQSGPGLSNSPRRAPSPRNVSGDSNNGKTLSYPLSPHAFRRLSHAHERRKAEDSVHRSEGSADSGTDTNGRFIESDGHLREDWQSRADLLIEENALLWHQSLLGEIEIGSRGTWELKDTTIFGFRRRSTRSASSPFSRWDIWSCSLDHACVSPGTPLQLDVVGLDSVLHDLVGSGLAPAEYGDNNIESNHQLPLDRVRHLLVTRNAAVLACLGNRIASFGLEKTQQFSRQLESSKVAGAVLY